jgi:hypothetical protein
VGSFYSDFDGEGGFPCETKFPLATFLLLVGADFNTGTLHTGISGIVQCTNYCGTQINSRIVGG